MKKLLSLLIVILIMITSACGEEKIEVSAVFVDNDIDIETLYDEIEKAEENGNNTVVINGCYNFDDVMSSADSFPKMNLIMVTDNKDKINDDLIPDNLSVMVFDDFEAGYIAGYAAVIEGYSNFGIVKSGDDFAEGVLCGINDGAAKLSALVKVKRANEISETMLGTWFVDGAECIFTGSDEIEDYIFDLVKAGNGSVVCKNSSYFTLEECVLTCIVYDYEGASESILNRARKWNEIGGKVTNIGVSDGAVSLMDEMWRFENFNLEQYETLVNMFTENSVQRCEEWPQIEITDYR